MKCILDMLYKEFNLEESLFNDIVKQFTSVMMTSIISAGSQDTAWKLSGKLLTLWIILYLFT